MNWKRFRLLGMAVLAGFFVTGCVSMNVKLVEDFTDPLMETTLEGEGADKVLVIPINGFITDQVKDGMMKKKPSLVKEVVSQLRKAESDPTVKAVVLKINSPGGTVTSTHILYNEINKLKSKRGVPIVVSMMDITTSGGYYLSLPADHIIAHQTTITGSVGVVFMRPKFQGMMDKIGVSIETNKSGKNKDMGSPFRATTDLEVRSFQSIIDELADLFEDKVAEHRKVSKSALKEIMTAKIYTANQALRLGMIDQLGFTDDAINKARSMAGLDGNSRVIMYRRVQFADDNIYNDLTARSGAGTPLVDLGPLSTISDVKPGFYYTWPAATE